MKLHEIALLAKDAKASKKFYHDVLGLHVDHEEDGLSVFNSGWPGLEIGCSEYPDSVHLSFIAAHVDKFAEQLAARGVKFVGPADIHLDKRAIALTDPDGLRILIQSPTEASPRLGEEHGGMNCRTHALPRTAAPSRPGGIGTVREILARDYCSCRSSPAALAPLCRWADGIPRS